MMLSDTARSDPDLRLQLLAMRGDIEFQYDLPAAEKTWTEVRRLASSLGRRAWVARATGELGTIAFLNGEVFKGGTMVALAYAEAEMYGDVTGRAKQLTALGEGLAEFGRPADAIHFFNRALTLYEANPDMYFPFTAYLGKARLLLATPQAAEGRKMLVTALEKARREGMRVREARILTTLGDDAIRNGHRAEAISWLKTACDAAARGGLDRIEADAASTLARVLTETGQLDEAAHYAKLSVSATEQTGEVYHLPERLAALAEIEVQRGALLSAEKTYRQATRLIESLFADLPNPKHRATLAATMGRVFEGHFDLVLNGFRDLSRAFEIIESARAHGIVDRIRQGQFVPRKDPAMVDQIAAINRRLLSEQDAAGRQWLLERLWETEWRSLPSSPVRLSPRPVPKALSLSQLQGTLRRGELLLEYVLGPSRSFVLAISRDHVLPYRLKKRDELEAAGAALLRAIQNRRESSHEARAVYAALLEPISVLPRSQRVIIVPDGVLNMAPFDAAVDSQGRRVVETHVISYAPSATAFYLLSSRKSVEPRRAALLGIGGASYKPLVAANIASTLRVGGLFSPLAPPSFPALRGSAVELSDVAGAGAWESELLIGNDATEDVLKRLPLSSFNILHFALHSAIDRDFPDRSGLVLSPDGNDHDDNLLQAREIMGLRLNADLVTLSACDGAAGSDSLVNAFLVAGARSVVASVWDADDIFSAALMRRFYANLSNGYDKAEALALAKRELLNIYGPNAIPFYWAGFRLVGDPHGNITGS
jgi:CHAT domain-containing protein